MAAITRLAAAIPLVSLVLVNATPFPGNEVCQQTTTTVYKTITLGADEDGSWPTATAKNGDVVSYAGGSYSSQTQQYTCPADFTYPGVTFPTFSPEKLNPNGPFYNPNDFIPYYADWPGKPSKGHTTVPPLPTKAAKPSGGASADQYQAPAWQGKGKDLTPGLSQEDTNGDSQWGLIDCPRLPPYVGAPSSGSVSASKTSGLPYAHTSASKSTFEYSYSSEVGPRASSHASYASFSAAGNHSMTSSHYSRPTSSVVHSSYSSMASNSTSNDTSVLCGKMPDTGVTRSYDFHVSYRTIAPDGVQKNGLVVNGAFPGPLVEANWGDWIQITVTNDLPINSTDQGEGTALHWHGFVQQETPYYDGVPSVQQCPIAPGKSLTYRFRADHVGTSWYHSHYSAQYAGGALGPIVIHGPNAPGVSYDEDLGPVFVNDWYHADYFSLVETTMAGGLPLADNILINGKMNYPCENTTAVCEPNAGISKFRFTPGKKYRLRLINPSAEALLKVSIDGHDMTIIANDFIAIKPYTTNVVTLGVGQRSDVIVEATGKAGDAFWMRAWAGNALTGTGCSLISGVISEGVAAVYYDGADENSAPETTSSLTTTQALTCENDDLSLTMPICPVALDPENQVATQTITMTFASNGTNFVWFMDGSTFRADYNINLLDHVIGGNMTFEKEWNVYKFDDAAQTSIRIIVENEFILPHPMHLHGHDFNILASGVGTWDGTITNPSNTQVRDVHVIPAGDGAGTNGYMVLQFKKDNPGVWPFHCHIAWHVSAGLYVNILEQPSAIDYTVPGTVQQTCDDWASWQAAGNVANQIDSGL